MLRWMCGKTRKDRIKNEHIWDTLGIVSIIDKSRVTYLRIEMVWTCLMQANNGTAEEKFLYVG